MVTGYILEILLLPYERYLEVTSNYKSLLYAYIPYSVIVLIMLYGKTTIPLIGLLPYVCITHSVRLVSSLISAYNMRRCYNSLLPVQIHTKESTVYLVVVRLLVRCTYIPVRVLLFLKKSFKVPFKFFS